MRGIAEIIIDKNNNGAISNVQMRFTRSEAKFYDID